MKYNIYVIKELFLTKEKHNLQNLVAVGNVPVKSLTNSSKSNKSLSTPGGIARVQFNLKYYTRDFFEIKIVDDDSCENVKNLARVVMDNLHLKELTCA
jgi:hypothetical protein